MKKILFFFIAILLVGCSKDNNGIDVPREVTFMLILILIGMYYIIRLIFSHIYLLYLKRKKKKLIKAAENQDCIINEEEIDFFSQYRKENKQIIIFVIVSGSLLLLGYLIESFYWKFIGGAGIIVFFVIIIAGIFTKENDSLKANTIGIGVVVCVIFTILNFFNSGTRYISSHGSKQHLYKDCRSFKSEDDVRKMSEMEAYFHLCFSDCKICIKRKSEERKQKRINKKIQELNEQKAELQERIDEIDYLIDKLYDGYDVDISDLEESDMDEVEEDFPIGVPSRYW